MFDYLVKVILETGSDLPDFWEDRRPEKGELVDFDDNTDDEDDGENDAGKGGATEGDTW